VFIERTVVTPVTGLTAVVAEVIDAAILPLLFADT